MTSYELGLLIHLSGVLLVFGGALVAGIVFEATRRRERPSEIALLLGVMSAELPRSLDDRLSLVANYVSSALFLVILALMVWQPGR